MNNLEVPDYKDVSISFLLRMNTIESAAEISNQDLGSMIATYETLIRYFDERGDVKILVTDLKTKLERFYEFMEYRKRNNRA